MTDDKIRSENMELFAGASPAYTAA